MIQVGVSKHHRRPVEERLQALARLLQERGLALQVEGWVGGPYVFFGCRTGPEPWSAAAPILRSQLAAVLAEAAVGPLTDRWLAHRLAAAACVRRFPLAPSLRSRAVALARQMVEAPPGESGPQAVPSGAGGASGTASPALSAPAGAGQGGVSVMTSHLLRWQAKLARQLVEALAARPEETVLESVVWFHSPSYMAALRKAAALAISELAAEREEQRSASPWRGLWLGPPPRLYEVHLFQEPGGAYHLLDRWGLPAGRRWPGESLAEAATEDAVVGHLMRLSPRRIVAHLPQDAPLLAAVRAAFPGRVHTCPRCPRCAALGRRHPAPSPSR